MDNVWPVEGGLVLWNPCFLRHFQDWEMVNIGESFWKLCVLVRSSKGVDRMFWKASKSG